MTNKISLQEARQKVSDYAIGDIHGINDCLSTPDYILSYPAEYRQALTEVMKYVYHYGKRPADLNRN